MTRAALALQRPAWLEAYDLAITEKLGQRETARRLGINRGTIQYRIEQVQKLLDGAAPKERDGRIEEIRLMNERLASAGRCRCGLLLPCVCLREAAAELLSRNYSEPTFPEGGP